MRGRSRPGDVRAAGPDRRRSARSGRGAAVRESPVAPPRLPAVAGVSGRARALQPVEALAHRLRVAGDPLPGIVLGLRDCVAEVEEAALGDLVERDDRHPCLVALLDRVAQRRLRCRPPVLPSSRTMSIRSERQRSSRGSSRKSFTSASTSPAARAAAIRSRADFFSLRSRRVKNSRTLRPSPNALTRSIHTTRTRRPNHTSAVRSASRNKSKSAASTQPSGSGDASRSSHFTALRLPPGDGWPPRGRGPVVTGPNLRATACAGRRPEPDHGEPAYLPTAHRALRDSAASSAPPQQIAVLAQNQRFRNAVTAGATCRA